MIETLSSILSWVWTITFWFLIVDLLLIRSLSVLYKWWQYGYCQGMPFCKPVYPIVGSQLRTNRIMKDDKLSPIGPFFPIIREDFGERPPSVVCLMMLFKPMIVLNDHKHLDDIFLNKNKYVDKEKLGGILTFPLLGDSIITSPNNESWKIKR